MKRILSFLIIFLLSLLLGNQETEALWGQQETEEIEDSESELPEDQETEGNESAEIPPYEHIRREAQDNAPTEDHPEEAEVPTPPATPSNEQAGSQSEFGNSPENCSIKIKHQETEVFEFPVGKAMPPDNNGQVQCQLGSATSWNDVEIPQEKMKRFLGQWREYLPNLPEETISQKELQGMTIDRSKLEEQYDSMFGMDGPSPLRMSNGNIAEKLFRSIDTQALNNTPLLFSNLGRLCENELSIKWEEAVQGGGSRAAQRWSETTLKQLEQELRQGWYFGLSGGDTEMVHLISDEKIAGRIRQYAHFIYNCEALISMGNHTQFNDEGIRSKSMKGVSSMTEGRPWPVWVIPILNSV